jgi:hypothetical protein
VGRRALALGERHGRTVQLDEVPLRSAEGAPGALTGWTTSSAAAPSAGSGVKSVVVKRSVPPDSMVARSPYCPLGSRADLSTSRAKGIGTCSPLVTTSVSATTSAAES